MKQKSRSLERHISGEFHSVITIDGEFKKFIFFFPDISIATNIAFICESNQVCEERQKTDKTNHTEDFYEWPTHE
jgi:hypothetical protein